MVVPNGERRQLIYEVRSDCIKSLTRSSDDPTLGPFGVWMKPSRNNLIPGGPESQLSDYPINRGICTFGNPPSEDGDSKSRINKSDGDEV